MDKAEARRRAGLVAAEKLKWQGHLDSQRAYKIALGTEMIDTYPKRIAELVNSELAKLGEITFPATAEAIVGIEECFEDAFLMNIGNSSPAASEDARYSFAKNVLGIEPSASAMPPEKDAENTIPYFAAANRKKASTNSEFGRAMLELLEKRADSWARNSAEWSELARQSPDHILYFQQYAGFMLRAFKDIDWDERLSRQNAEEYLENARDFLRRHASSAVLAEYIIRDGLESRQDKQQLVLAAYLDETMPESYQSAFEIVKRRASMPSLPPAAVIESSFFSHEEALETASLHGEMAKGIAFLRRAFAGNKNYIKNYIQEHGWGK